MYAYIHFSIPAAVRYAHPPKAQRRPTIIHTSLSARPGAQADSQLINQLTIYSRIYKLASFLTHHLLPSLLSQVLLPLHNIHYSPATTHSSPDHA